MLTALTEISNQSSMHQPLMTTKLEFHFRTTEEYVMKRLVASLEGLHGWGPATFYPDPDGHYANVYGTVLTARQTNFRSMMALYKTSKTAAWTSFKRSRFRESLFHLNQAILTLKLGCVIDNARTIRRTSIDPLGGRPVRYEVRIMIIDCCFELLVTAVRMRKATEHVGSLINRVFPMIALVRNDRYWYSLAARYLYVIALMQKIQRQHHVNLGNSDGCRELCIYLVAAISTTSDNQSH